MADPAMARAMEADMRRRFWFALAFTIPVTIIAGHLPGVPMLVHPPLANWLGLLLATPVVWWSGWVFISGSYWALKRRRLDMSVLIATGVLAAYFSSVYLTVIGQPTAYYEAASMLVTFVLFGHWMEMRSRRGTSDALRALFDLVPPTARVLRNGVEVVLSTSEVVVGDRLRLRPGDKVPVDGDLIEGATDVDEALVTGESRPVRKGPGDALIGGAINISGAVTMRATKVGSDTVLAQIAALVARAQNSKAPRQRLADRAAAVLVVVAVGAGVLTFVGWTLLAGAPFLTALTFAISAVVIACPDALGLATPTAVAVGTGLGARHNILIKDAATLEGVSRIQTVILDKTGTLTAGKPSVTDIVPVPGTTAEAMLRLASPVAGQSTHPLSQAIVAAAAERGLAPEGRPDQVSNVPGQGLRGVVAGTPVLVGNAALLREAGVEVTTVQAERDRLAGAGRSLVYVAGGGRLLGLLGITDPIRPTARPAIAELRRMGIRPVLLSGDLEATARRVAAGGPDAVRPDGHLASRPAQPGHGAEDEAEPGLGQRLQPVGHPRGGRCVLPVAGLVAQAGSLRPADVAFVDYRRAQCRLVATREDLSVQAADRFVPSPRTRADPHRVSAIAPTKDRMLNTVMSRASSRGASFGAVPAPVG